MKAIIGLKLNRGDAMIIIGLTGNTGSGKSIVAKCLQQHNMFVIDSDKIAHEIIKKGKPAYDEVIELFGAIVLDNNGEINRKKLGSIVFTDKIKLEQLTRCTHRHIVLEIKQIIKNNQSNDQIKGLVIDAPLLIEAGLDKIVDEVWVVYSDSTIRAGRIMKRDNITYEQAINRMNSQMSWNELSRYADVILYNNSTIDEVVQQVNTILRNKEGFA